MPYVQSFIYIRLRNYYFLDMETSFGVNIHLHDPNSVMFLRYKINGRKYPSFLAGEGNFLIRMVYVIVIISYAIDSKHYIRFRLVQQISA